MREVLYEILYENLYRYWQYRIGNIHIELENI